MKSTLYEALGITQAASEQDVRAALRGLIRKYYAKTRDGQGNLEEALRFINHASRILSDPLRRSRYDQELALTAEGTTEQRIAHFVSHVATEQHGAPSQDEVTEAPVDESIDEDEEGVPERHFHHPGLTERVASF